jgi:GxxExxY protein
MEPPMNTDEHRLLEAEKGVWEHDALTESVIGCAFKVANALGPGFLEKVYENALAHDLRKSGLVVVQQAPIQVTYDGEVVGSYVTDLLIESRLILELKACRTLDDTHVAQCLNYLKATGLRTCLLLNFGVSKLQIKRLSL